MRKNEIQNKNYLFTEVPVINKDGDLILCDKDYANMFKTISIDTNSGYSIPIIPQTMMDITNAISHPTVMSDIASKSFHHIMDSDMEKAIKQISEQTSTMILDDISGAIKKELTMLLYQAKRTALLKVYEFIRDDLKEIIDYEVFSNMMTNLQLNNLYEDPMSDKSRHLRLNYDISAMIHQMVFVYYHLISKPTDKQIDAVNTISSVKDMMDYGVLMANSEAQSLYYEVYKIIGTMLLPEIVPNETVVTIMSTLDATGLFHDYHDSIVDTISYIMEKTKVVSEYVKLMRDDSIDNRIY